MTIQGQQVWREDHLYMCIRCGLTNMRQVIIFTPKPEHRQIVTHVCRDYCPANYCKPEEPKMENIL